MFELPIMSSIFWVCSISIIVFIIFFIVKLITFIRIFCQLKLGRFSKSLKASTDLTRFILELEGRLDKYLFIFPLMVFLNFLYLLYHDYVNIYNEIWAYRIVREIMIEFMVRGILKSSAELLAIAGLLILYSAAWILFSRWKFNILRNIEINKYETTLNTDES